MPLLSPRMIIPVTMVVVAWAGVHLLTSRDLTVAPGTWPSSPATPAAGPNGARLPTASPGASPTAGDAAGGVPFIPSALRQLNSATRDTAVGLYALIQELEHALRRQLEQLARRAGRGG